MSERYVKDILEKLEEIEKLHSKLRSLVPRVKNYESENTASTPAEKLPKNTENEQSIRVEMKEDEGNSSKQIPLDTHRSFETLRNFCKASKTNVRKFFASLNHDSKYFKGSKLRKLKSTSVDFAKKQWQDKGDKIKNLLYDIIERDIILVNTASQTSDTIDPPLKNEEKPESSSKTNQHPKKRRRTVQDQLDRLLEHFNYSRDPDRANGNRVATHRHSLDKDEPRRVQKNLLFPDEQSETLKIVSSAERISVNDNKKGSSSEEQSQKFLKKRSNISKSG